MNRLLLLLLAVISIGCTREVYWERATGTVVAIELDHTRKVDNEYMFYSTYKDSTDCVISFTVDDLAATDRLDPAYCQVHAVGDRIDVIKITASDVKAGGNYVRSFYLVQRPDVTPESMARVVKQWGSPRRR